jgi:von Willebrand factor type A domain
MSTIAGGNGRWRRLAAVSAASVLLAVTAQQGVATGRQNAPIGPKPVTIVLLVDESGSLGDDGVAAEREAAALLAQAEISTGSQVTVIGFGGNSGIAGQTPVVTRCQTTTVSSSQDRDYLSRCVLDIHRRSDAEGQFTDYPRALDQALAVFDQAPAETRKILFLLTDGKLDVSGDPSYGRSVAERNAAALRQMQDNLATARDAGVQVWPLGFGNAEPVQLDDFAARGSQQLCGPGSPAPRARVVTDVGQVVDSLAEAYAAARCLGVNRSETKPLPTGTSVSLTVDVPKIATDGSIAVIKRDPLIRVEYYDPNGELMPKFGRTKDGVSTFQVSGEGGIVEVLRITDPLPGRWEVRLFSSPGIAPQNVMATVLWQGAVRATATLNPPAPRAGERVVAEVTLQTRREQLTDPEVLRQLTVQATLTGEGFAPVELVLADNGTEGDERASDGKFAAQFSLPSSATGVYQLVATVGGSGVEASQVPFDGRVATAQGVIRAQVRLPHERVAPGGALHGTIEASNDSGASRTVRLQLTDLSEGTLATVTPAQLELPASGTASLPFQIVFDRATPVGAQGLRLLVVDDEQPAIKYAATSVIVDVGYPPPPWWKRYQWWLLGALGAVVLIMLAAAISRFFARRADRDVRGLVLLLFRDEAELGFLAAPDLPTRQFWFVIRDEQTGQPRLDHANPGNGFVATRGAGGTVFVRVPGGDKVRLKAGVPQPVAGDLALAVRDERYDGGERVRRRRFSPAPGGPDGGPDGGAGGGLDDGAAGSTAGRWPDDRGTQTAPAAPGQSQSPFYDDLL